uniref:G-protein coupled receptors family 3 profile domain-containing protein n=1 Tax=Xenopus tropicalis TaxID=8364 RepID=A0A1B8Y7K4_XENTR
MWSSTNGLLSDQLRVIFCLAAIWVTACSTELSGSDSPCRIPLTKPKYEYKYIKDGDIIIGGVFSVNCGMYYIPDNTGKYIPLCKNPIIDRYLEIQAFTFTADEINNNPDLLPNITLGYHVYDSCGDPRLAIGSVLQILSGPGNVVPNYSCRGKGEIAGFIGDRSTVTSLPIAQLLGIYGYSQISYGVPHSVLNDRVQYPYYFSTGPNDHIQHIAIAELVERLGWTWVIILAASGDYGERESKNLRNEITKHGACIDFIGALTEDKDRDIKTLVRIQKSTAEVVILCGELFRTRSSLFLVEKMIKDKTLLVPVTWFLMYTQLLFNGGLQFTETIVGVSDSAKFDTHVMANEEDVLLKDLLATDGFCLTHDKEKDDLFQLAYNHTYWNCSRSKLTARIFFPSYRVHRAVMGLAHAAHDLLSTSHNKDTHINIHRKELHRYLRNVRYNEGRGREIVFNELMNTPMGYIICALYSDSKVNLEETIVGKYFWSKSGRSLEINTQEIRWKKNTNNQTLKSQCSPNCPPGSRKLLRERAPPCCYDCARCSEGEISNVTDAENCLKCGDNEWPNLEKTHCIQKQMEFLSYTDDSLTVAFILLSLVFFIIAAVILGIFISYRDSPIVRANNRSLSFLLLVSIKLSFLSVFLFLGRPVDITCMLRIITFGITFSIAVSSLLAKTIMVCVAFKATKPGSSWRKWLGVKLSNSVVLFCSSIQIIICMTWLAISPPFQELDIHTSPGTIIIQCNEGSAIGFYSVIGYMGLLAAVSFVLAFLARSLPDSFNEAKYITFSMLLFCSVWITMIPAYLSTKGKNTVCVEIFAILTSSAGLLASIFLPKCYIILLKPEMNTKEYLLGNNK